MKYIINGLRWLANKLENIKCAIHFKWNALLEKLKTNCVCEKLEK